MSRTASAVVTIANKLGLHARPATLFVDRACIAGFMEAMTMPFEVRQPGDLRGVVPGAIVEFTLVVGAESAYATRITVRRCDQSEPVDGKSIMQMLMLAATQGTRLEITAEGNDADEAVRNLVRLVEGGFDEE